MNQYSKNRQFPAGNPLANALVVIVGALAIGLSVILGVVAFVALGSVLLVLGAIIAIRIWWLNRKLPKGGPAPADRQPSGVIEGEFRVVSDDKNADPPPQ